MSVLNDALKRASEAQQELDTVRINLRPASASALKPQSARQIAPASIPQATRDLAPELKPEPTSDWESESRPQQGSSSVLPALVILVIAAAALCILLAHFVRSHRSHITTAAAVPPPVHAAAPKPVSPPAMVKTVKVTAPAIVSAPTQWARLKVQAIFYSGAKSQAIVNGQSVYVGNMVKGFRVAAISPNNVLFIAPDGSQKKLGLGE